MGRYNSNSLVSKITDKIVDSIGVVVASAFNAVSNAFDNGKWHLQTRAKESQRKREDARLRQEARDTIEEVESRLKKLGITPN